MALRDIGPQALAGAELQGNALLRNFEFNRNMRLQRLEQMRQQMLQEEAERHAKAEAKTKRQQAAVAQAAIILGTLGAGAALAPAAAAGTTTAGTLGSAEAMAAASAGVPVGASVAPLASGGFWGNLGSSLANMSMTERLALAGMAGREY